MQNHRPFQPPARNPITQQKHRHEVFWQITVPLIAGVLIIVTIGLTIAVAGNMAQINKLANVSMIFLIVPAMFFTLIGIAITVASVYGLVRLILVMPYYMRLAQNFMLVVRIRVSRVSDAATEPFLRIPAWRPSAGPLRRSLRRKPPAR